MKTTRRDKELFESQHYNRRTTRPLTFPFSRSFSAPLNGRGLADGMWFDGSNDTVIVAGSSFNAKTTGKITGVFQTASTGVVCVCAATDAGDTASDLRINISAGKFQFAAREYSGHDINVKTNATYNDGAAHTFEIKVTASGTSITMDGVLLEASELTFTVGSTSSHIWFSDVDDIDMWAIGVRQESVPDNKFLGVVRDIKIYDEDTTTVIGQWDGYGNTNADWEDKGTGDVGMWFDGSTVGDMGDVSALELEDFDISFTSTRGTVGAIRAQFSMQSSAMSGQQCGVWLRWGAANKMEAYVVTGTNTMTLVSSAAFTDTGIPADIRLTKNGTDVNLYVDGVVVNGTLPSATMDYASAAKRTNLGVYTLNTGPTYTGNKADGLIRDVVVKTFAGVLVAQWDGHGNTNADWTDKVGSNDVTLSATPSRAVSTATGWREANDGTVAGSPSRAISTDNGKTWSVNLT